MSSFNPSRRRQRAAARVTRQAVQDCARRTGHAVAGGKRCVCGTRVVLESPTHVAAVVAAGVEAHGKG